MGVFKEIQTDWDELPWEIRQELVLQVLHEDKEMFEAELAAHIYDQPMEVEHQQMLDHFNAVIAYYGGGEKSV